MGDIKIPYICPFALLWALCNPSEACPDAGAAPTSTSAACPDVGPASTSAARPDVASEACPDGYASLLQRCFASGQKGRVVLYVDEVVPGNPLRPENRRSFYSFFWLFMDYPDWFRSSDMGWHDFCTVTQEHVKAIPGGVSAIVARILSIFWGEGDNHNMERLGVRVACPRGTIHIKAGFGAFLLDERAEKFICCVKGSSGTKVCMSCQNVVARAHPDAVLGTGLRRFACPSRESRVCLSLSVSVSVRLLLSFLMSVFVGVSLPVHHVSCLCAQTCPCLSQSVFVCPFSPMSRGTSPSRAWQGACPTPMPASPSTWTTSRSTREGWARRSSERCSSRSALHLTVEACPTAT